MLGVLLMEVRDELRKAEAKPVRAVKKPRKAAVSVD